MLPTKFGTPKEGLGEFGTPKEGLGDTFDCYSSPDDDEEVETPNLTQPSNSRQTTQDKGKRQASTSSVHGNVKKEWQY
jgi:hypothetical protein